MSLHTVCLQGSETCLSVPVFCSTNLTLSYCMLGCSAARKHFPSAPSAVLELTLLDRGRTSNPSHVHVLQLMLYTAAHIITYNQNWKQEGNFYSTWDYWGWSTEVVLLSSVIQDIATAQGYLEVLFDKFIEALGPLCCLLCYDLVMTFGL